MSSESLISSSRYYHYQIQKGETEAETLEFSHITAIGRKGMWNEKQRSSLPNCKINVFMKGDFSVIVGNKIFSPMYGDLCFLAPNEVHFGKIPNDTELDYFEFNIGEGAFNQIPNGNKLLEWLINREKNKAIFVRPRSNDAELLITLCREIESAIDQQKIALAYAETLRFLDILNRVYSAPNNVEPSPISKNCSLVIKYIEEHFGEQITISQLSNLCKVSEAWLSRSFKSEIGITIHNYILNCRMRAAVSMLYDKPIVDIGYLCGFSDASHFISQFKRYFGMTPLEYKRKHCTNISEYS